MELFIFARFHVHAGNVRAAEKAIADVVEFTAKEAGCLSIQAFRSTRDLQLFYIHSRWANEEAFEKHAILSHTVCFIQQMESLVDQPLEVTRTERILIV